MPKTKFKVTTSSFNLRHASNSISLEIKTVTLWLRSFPKFSKLLFVSFCYYKDHFIHFTDDLLRCLKSPFGCLKNLRCLKTRQANYRRNWIVRRQSFSFRKEVIQPQVLLQLPCYDFTPIMNHTVVICLLAVGSTTSSTTHFRDVTGGVYKTRERIHRSVLICDY